METLLLQRLKKINVRYKTAMISCFLWGLVAHGMGLFNKYSMHDDIAALFGVGSTYSLGRWFLQKLADWFSAFSMSGHFSTPLIHGLFSFLCTGVSLCLIVKLLEIRHIGLIIMLAGIMSVFPVITGLFGYMFTAPYYMLALLMTVSGTYLLCRKRKWYTFLIGTALNVCAAGVYQAFIPVTLSLMVIFMIAHLDREGKPSGDDASMLTHLDDTKHHLEDVGVYSTRREWMDILGWAVWLAAACVVFMGVYFLVNHIELAVHQETLSDYMGTSSMGTSGIRTYLSRIHYAYRQFFDPTDLKRGTSDSMFPMRTHTIYRFLILFGGILSVVRVFHWRRNWSRAIQMALLMLLFPLAAEFIFVMVEPEAVHQLMVYGQAMIFVYLAWLLDRFTWPKQWVIKTVYAIGMICLLLMNGLYCRYDNICYLKMDFQQQRAISYFNVLIAEIKGTNGYRDEYPVAFLNERHIQDLSLTDIPEFDEVRMLPLQGSIADLVNNYQWLGFMNDWCGYNPTLAEASEFENLPEVQEMPHYPDQGSIQVINDTVVVKF